MMDNRIRMFLRLIIVVLIFHVQQSKSIYCQGIVDSVKIVTSCPESKAEWDYAARRKDCSIIASKQDCSSGLQFEYHCVINEYRSKLLEVCAPRRLIFGYCVEFNVAGGVIQRHWSAPCNETFPKCDTFYFSTKAYLCASKSRRNGPDDLQPHSEQGHDASDNQSGKLSTVQSDSAQGKDASDNQSEELSSVQSDSDNICDHELPTRTLSPAPSSIQSASSGSTFYEDAFEGRSNDPDDLQPNSEQGHDASDNQSGKLSTVQSVSVEDASEGRGNDPDDLQPHSEQGHDASDSQSEELSTMQSDSEKTFSCSEVKDMLP
uniref:Chitin-binding type-2 domain-containing protein n=1 Tax=Magallana gigas TaxID=29159 RepID=A0A8W8JGP8_MAGGI